MYTLSGTVTPSSDAMLERHSPEVALIHSDPLQPTHSCWVREEVSTGQQSRESTGIAWNQVVPRVQTAVPC